MLRFDDLIEDQGEAALIIEVDEKEQKPLHIAAYAPLPTSLDPNTSSNEQSPLRDAMSRLFLFAALQNNHNDPSTFDPSAGSLLSQPSYTSTQKTSSCQVASVFTHGVAGCTVEDSLEEDCADLPDLVKDSDSDERPSNTPYTHFTTSFEPPRAADGASTPIAVFGKRYKPVAQKVKPVIGTLPQEFRIIRNITGDPLKDKPTLDPRPPPFVPTGRYTKERMEALDAVHKDGFLHPEERKLLHHFMTLHHEAFAWTDAERGCFKEEYFPPVDIPTIPHHPWIQKNIPIPPGIYEEVCKMIQTKIQAGVYEPSNSSYRSRWFCVAKKDGRLRIVHSLEPLNKVTIQHSGVTPIPEHLAENFACRACGAMLDLFVGYDERLIARNSRDLTTFQTPFGALRLVTLPMGWTNSVPIFHDDVTYILQLEIPDYTIPYIDDVPVKGPASRYQLEDGSYETISENDGIRCFVWEHFQNLNRIVQRMKYAGGTFSGKKLVLCAEEITVVGHVCTIEGRVPDNQKVEAILAWGPCQSLSDVRAFLGTVGLFRIYIWHYSLKAHPLTMLTKKGVEFEFGEEQIRAQNELKKAVLDSPAI